MTRGATASTLACLLSALCLASCTQPPGADGDPARRQVMKDAQGRPVRLDPVTGQVTPIDPPAAGRAVPRGDASASAPSQDTPSPAEGAAPPPVPPEPPAPDTVTVQPAVVAESAACVPRGSVPPRDVITVTAADAFVRPGRLQAPVATLPANTRARAVSVEGEWLLLRFDVGPGGDQRAYVHCSQIAPFVEDR